MTALGYLRMPHLSGETLTFITEDDVWTAPLGGGIARRLTSGAGECSLPRISPDGTLLAYVSREEGHPEIAVMPAIGGSARRLTFLGSDVVTLCGWSPDGTELFFTSDAGSPFARETSAYAIGLDGGTPRELELGHATTIAVDARGRTLIGRNATDPARWKRYRGGTAGHLWVDANGDGTFARLGRELNGNLVWPMWVGERVAFLSDHEGIGNIYSCTPDGSDLRRHSNEREYYARFPSTDGTRIVYAAGADLVLLDPQTDAVQRIPVQTPSNAPQLARRFVDGSDTLESFEPSPDGKGLAITTRGRVFVMPLWEEAVIEHGGDDGARRRNAIWLHETSKIAYVDDTAGFERIAIAAAAGGAPTYVTTGDIGRVTELVASPVDDTLAFANHRYELYAIAPGGEPRKLDTGRAMRISELAFSPDGRYLAYAWSPAHDVSIVRIVDLHDDSIHDATSALRTDGAPAWDPEGKYLYVISARDFNPIYDALQFDLSFPLATRPYLLTLRADVPNPFVPQPAPIHRGKDDDDGDDKDDKDDKPEKLAITIDFDGLPQRMLAFPVEEGSYDWIGGVKGRAVFTQFPVRGIKLGGDDEHGEGAIVAYDFEEHRSATLAAGLDACTLGFDGRTLVYAAHDKLRVIDAGGDLPEDEDEPKPPTEMNRRSGWVDLARISVRVEPSLEWAQMLREAWRLQREQFWDADMSGIDWDVVLKRYAALVPRLRTRSELSDLIWEMHGELGTSHAYEMGGDVRIPPQYRRGFLGADYAWDDAAGGYTISRIYRGDSWDRDLDSPLAEPGINVRVGDTIVAVGSRALSREEPPDALLVNLAGREVSLTIARGGEGRRVVVKTLRDERLLRYRAWVEGNRALVHARTNGAVGYLHIPDMGPWGFAEFHRGYLSEFDRKGLIVDVRYNRGGHVSPLLLEKLARKRVGYDVMRYGPMVAYPPESVAGPIVALTNQFAGSDGDIFSHCFKLYGLGPLIGMRTWGGVVGINPYHTLIDGTLTTQPEFSFWFTDVGWTVENYGTDPDYEVDIAPHDAKAGRDPQMEKALELVLDAVAKAPPPPVFTPRPQLPLPMS